MEPVASQASREALRSPERFDAEEVAAKLEPMDASGVISWGFEEFGEDLYFACSFQKTRRARTCHGIRVCAERSRCT